MLGFYISKENSLYLLAVLKLFDRSIGLIFFIHFIRSFMILISIVQIVTYSVKISSHKPSILKLLEIICPQCVPLLEQCNTFIQCTNLMKIGSSN